MVTILKSALMTRDWNLRRRRNLRRNLQKISKKNFKSFKKCTERVKISPTVQQRKAFKYFTVPKSGRVKRAKIFQSMKTRSWTRSGTPRLVLIWKFSKKKSKNLTENSSKKSKHESKSKKKEKISETKNENQNKKEWHMPKAKYNWGYDFYDLLTFMP